MSQDDQRTGMTLRYRTEKLAAIEAELGDDAHYERTPSLAYGEHDPFEVPLQCCEACGGEALVRSYQGSKGRRWTVECTGCGVGLREPARKEWAAALAWNSVNLATAPSYRELPLFGLSQLDPDAARERLTGFRRDLELRQKAAGLRRSIRQEQGGRPPGKGYQERLEAYLKWCLFALRLVKHQRNTPPR